ncbi:MAG: DUF1844 domain-containing protein [Armatimonadota bacterium]
MTEEINNKVTDQRTMKITDDGDVVLQNDKKADEEIDAPEAEDIEEIMDENMHYPPVDIYSLIRSFIGILGSQTWQWLGLLKNPSTGELETDLQQARIAIDTIAGLVKQIEGHLSSAEQREIQNALSDLRMNFVQQSAKTPK